MGLDWSKLVFLNQTHVVSNKVSHPSHVDEKDVSLVQIPQFERNQLHNHRYSYNIELYWTWSSSNWGTWTKAAPDIMKYARSPVFIVVICLWFKYLNLNETKFSIAHYYTNSDGCVVGCVQIGVFEPKIDHHDENVRSCIFHYIWCIFGSNTSIWIKASTLTLSLV